MGAGDAGFGVPAGATFLLIAKQRLRRIIPVFYPLAAQALLAFLTAPAFDFSGLKIIATPFSDP
jgi:hypothetical protein